MTKYLHTMIRVSDPAATIAFFELIGVKEVRRYDNEAARFSLIFLAAPGGEGVAEVEPTHNWDESGYTGCGNFGHLAYGVEDIYATCQTLADAGVTHSTARRATGGWPSSARRTGYRWNCSRSAKRWLRVSLGRAWRMWGSGEGQLAARPVRALAVMLRRSLLRLLATVLFVPFGLAVSPHPSHSSRCKMTGHHLTVAG